MIFRRENDRVHAGATADRRWVRAAAVVAGVVAAVPAAGLATAGSASAASVATWDRVAQYESGGNWQADTGNGYYGGLQFSQSTWDAYGGADYAPNAALASKGQQIAIAEKVLAAQGPGAWPNTAWRAGLTRGGEAPEISTAGEVTVRHHGYSHVRGYTHRTHRSVSTGSVRINGADYTVRSGDTLSSIAQAKGISWRKLYQRNLGVVGANPNFITPGERLAV